MCAVCCGVGVGVGVGIGVGGGGGGGGGGVGSEPSLQCPVQPNKKEHSVQQRDTCIVARRPTVLTRWRWPLSSLPPHCTLLPIPTMR